MEPIRIYTVSLGCPKNRVDTERLLAGFGAAMVPADSVEDSDLVLINTCGFIQPAIEESVNTIVDAIDAAGGMDKRPLLAVAGCLVSRFGGDLATELPEVDLWLNTFEIDAWPALVREALRREFTPERSRRLSTAPSYAYLKVGEGCSHGCRFCTIPSIRGPHISRPLESLVGEARELLDQGVPELVVVGQDVTAYGSDLGMSGGLRQLVGELSKMDDLQWLRLMYLYPAGLTDETLSFLAAIGKPLLPYFDVPLQHAHPEVLQSMGRPFARDPNLVVERIRSHFLDAALRTSIIVGYPGETEEHFAALMDFVERTRFHHMGVFPYHAEEGTPAAAMPDQVDDAVKQWRRDSLMELQADISSEIMETYVGSFLDVLVEEASPEWPGLFTGRVWFQAPDVDGVTYLSADPESDVVLEPGKIVRAEIVEAKDYDLVGLV